MQTLSRNPHQHFEPDVDMTPDLAALFPGPGEWNDAPYGDSMSVSNNNYPNFPGANSNRSLDRYSLNPNLNQASFAAVNGGDERESTTNTASRSLTQYNKRTNSNLPISLALKTSTGYSSQPTFVTMNTSMSASNAANTISPLQTNFDSSMHVDCNYSTDGNLYSAASPTYDPWSKCVEDDKSLAQRRRRGSTLTDGGAASSPVARKAGRRRQSENVEPGSSRAVYLEKNRKAASKCRSKQKKHQEELVETARDFERKNKALKAEVEFLKSDMRDLMEMIGKHTDCPDTRLRTYVQREADRLAAGASPVAELFSSSNDGGSSEGR